MGGGDSHLSEVGWIWLASSEGVIINSLPDSAKVVTILVNLVSLFWGLNGDQCTLLACMHLTSLYTFMEVIFAYPVLLYFFLAVCGSLLLDFWPRRVVK